MSEFREKLTKEFQDREYREAYADDFADTYLATQISAIREQRHLTQAALGQMAGTQQEGISRIENVNYSRWNISTLKKIAFALGTRLKVSLETFGSLVDEAEAFSRHSLQRPSFEEDPVFSDSARMAAAIVPPESREAPDQRQTPVSAVRRIVLSWLEQSDWHTKQLIDWFQGYGLPPLGEEEEPYVWLLRAVPLGAEAYPYKKALATRLAALLREQPDVHRPGRRPEDVLMNLFLLCAGLDYPELLAQPLFEVYGRLERHETEMTPEVLDSLVASLIRNQIDDRLRPVWEQMVEHGRHASLPGNEYTGLAGIRRMRHSSNDGGQPDMSAIGWAFKQMAIHLDKRNDKRRVFRSLVEQFIDLYPGQPQIDATLIMEADKNEWPRWAVESLPSLFVYIDSGRVFAWVYALACIPPRIEFEVNRELCDSDVLDVSLTLEAETFLRLLAPSFERARLSNPFPSDKSVIGVIAAALADEELIAAARKWDLAPELLSARRRLLGQAGIIPDVIEIHTVIKKLDRSPASKDRKRVHVIVKAAEGIFGSQTLLREAKRRLHADDFSLIETLFAA